MSERRACQILSESLGFPLSRPCFIATKDDADLLRMIFYKIWPITLILSFLQPHVFSSSSLSPSLFFLSPCTTGDNQLTTSFLSFYISTAIARLYVYSPTLRLRFILSFGPLLPCTPARAARHYLPNFLRDLPRLFLIFFPSTFEHLFSYHLLNKPKTRLKFPLS